VLRKFAALSATHPMIGEACPACGQPFKEGDATTLIVLGPGSDEEQRKNAAEGRAYNAVAAPVHWACATGEEA
jgi:hypothetical protein